MSINTTNFNTQTSNNQAVSRQSSLENRMDELANKIATL